METKINQIINKIKQKPYLVLVAVAILVIIILLLNPFSKEAPEAKDNQQVESFDDIPQTEFSNLDNSDDVFNELDSASEFLE